MMELEAKPKEAIVEEPNAPVPISASGEGSPTAVLNAESPVQGSNVAKQGDGREAFVEELTVAMELEGAGEEPQADANGEVTAVVVADPMETPAAVDKHPESPAEGSMVAKEVGDELAEWPHEAREAYHAGNKIKM